MARVLVGLPALLGDIHKYEKRYDLVELRPVDMSIPRASTLRGWRKTVPPAFVFSVVLPRAVGALSGGPEAEAALTTALEVATAVEARCILLSTPATVRPPAANRRRIAGLFERLPREGVVLAWEPGGVWEREDVRSPPRKRPARCPFSMRLASASRRERWSTRAFASSRKASSLGPATIDRVAERLRGRRERVRHRRRAERGVEGEGRLAGRARQGPRANDRRRGRRSRCRELADRRRRGAVKGVAAVASQPGGSGGGARGARCRTRRGGRCDRRLFRRIRSKRRGPLRAGRRARRRNRGRRARLRRSNGATRPRRGPSARLRRRKRNPRCSSRLRASFDRHARAASRLSRARLVFRARALWRRCRQGCERVAPGRLDFAHRFPGRPRSPRRGDLEALDPRRGHDRGRHAQRGGSGRRGRRRRSGDVRRSRRRSDRPRLPVDAGGRQSEHRADSSHGRRARLARSAGVRPDL